MSTPGFADLLPGEGAAFTAFWEIYQEALPASERKAQRVVRAMLERADYRVRVLRDGDSVRGFSVLWIDADGGGPALLEYMAIERGYRGRGWGGALYLDALSTVRAAGAARPLLIEVDAPQEGAADLALRQRRLAFYQRLGCRRVAGLDYILPLPGLAPPMMWLLVDEPGANEVRRAWLRSWLEALYTRVYGQSADDPRLDQMLRPVGDPTPLLKEF